MVEENPINLKIKMSNGTTFDVTIKASQTVEDLKKACVEGSSIPWDNQRLIFKGKILKDPENISTYKMESGVTVHLVKGAGSAAPTTGPSTGASATGSNPAGAGAAGAGANPFMGAGMGGGMPGMGMGGGMPNMMAGGGMSGMGGMNLNPSQINEVLNNPMMQQMLQNPEMLNQMIQMNPMLRQMAENNPQLQAMLANPEMMRAMMTPQNIQAAMNLMGNGPQPGMGMMGAMGGQPGSFPAPGGAAGATGAAGAGAG